MHRSSEDDGVDVDGLDPRRWEEAAANDTSMLPCEEQSDLQEAASSETSRGSRCTLFTK